MEKHGGSGQMTGFWRQRQWNYAPSIEWGGGISELARELKVAEEDFAPLVN